MQATVEETGGLGRKIRVEVPVGEINAAVKERMTTLKGQVRINGFRPGKVPASVMEKRFGEPVREEITGELMQKSLSEAIEQNELRPVRIDNVDREEEAENLVFTAKFDVFPAIELTGLESIEVNKTVADVAESDIDTALENIQRSRAEFSEVERASADGDRVIVDFDGTIDGVAFDGGKAEQANVDLGSGGFLPDFEAALMGVSAGDEKTFDVAFPADYGAENLAGNTAQFAAKVHAVQAAELPELNDEFAEQMGFAEGGVDALREAVSKNMQEQAEQQFAGDIREQVMAGLFEANKGFELPQSLIDAELEGLKQRAGEGDEDAPSDEDMLEDAKKRVSLGLLVAEVSRSREITVNEERVNQRLFQLIGNNPQAYEIFQNYRQDEQVMQSISTAVLEEQVVESLLATAKVNETSKPFAELNAK